MKPTKGGKPAKPKHDYSHKNRQTGLRQSPTGCKHTQYVTESEAEAAAVRAVVYGAVPMGVVRCESCKTWRVFKHGT